MGPIPESRASALVRALLLVRTLGPVTVLVLWDVDHTLVENSGVSKATYAAAFERIAGRPPGQPARTNGRTDRLIMADMFRAHAFESPAWPVVYAALEDAGAEFFGEMSARGFVLP